MLSRINPCFRIFSRIFCFHQSGGKFINENCFCLFVLAQSSSKPSSGKTVMNSTTMDGISEAQTEVASIPPPSLLHHSSHSTHTSVSQEPIFEAEGVAEQHDQFNADDDDINVSFFFICLNLFSI